MNRNKVYHKPVKDQSEDLALMRKMDREYLEHPTKGVLGMVDFLQALGILVGPKRVRRLLRKMIVAILSVGIYPTRWMPKVV
jgi:putative transposase